MAKACFLTALANTLWTPAKGENLWPDESRYDSADRYRYGPFDVRFNARGSIVYDDNIFIRPDKESDVIWTLSPGILLGAGDYQERVESLTTISYSPSFVLFTDHSDNNAIDHDAQLRLQWRPGRAVFGLQHTYQNYSGAVVDAGSRVDREIHSTALLGTYEFSPKTAFEFSASQSINHYERLLCFNEWIVGGAMDYTIVPKVKLGAGFNAGFVDIQQSPNQCYQQALLRGNYAWTEKLDVRGSVGGELRQFDGGRGDKATPVFSVGANYRPLELTSLRLEAYRRTQTSVRLANQNYITTGFSAGVRQVFREKYSFQVSGGYENADYDVTLPGQMALRDDDYFFVRTGVDCALLDRFTGGVFYQYRRNDSRDATFTFSNHQVGVNFAYRF